MGELGGELDARGEIYGWWRDVLIDYAGGTFVAIWLFGWGLFFWWGGRRILIAWDGNTRVCDG